MRRSVSSIAALVGLVGISLVASGTAALAAQPGKKVCAIKDPRLRELSGLVATDTGYIVINDGTEVASRKQVFYLDKNCKGTKAVQYSGDGPFDTEDLALSADGKTLWIADIGDNVTSSERRSRVALWSMPVDGSKKPVLHRLRYPDGKPRDAEALLMADDGSPVIVTKSTGKAEIFTADAKLPTDNAEPVPMKAAGEITVPKTATENPLQAAGRIAVTGAARSPDGTRVVLRTYADAFEFDVTGGDIVKALTTGKPRVTPLTDPFGEAITYTPDGGTFLTVSDVGSLGDDAEVDILSYVPSKTVAADVPDETEKATDTRSWMDKLTLTDITYLVAGVGVLGAILVGFGIFGIVRARRRPPVGDAGRRGGKGGDDAGRRGGKDGGQGRRGGGPERERDPRVGRQPGPEDQSDAHFVSAPDSGRRAGNQPDAADGRSRGRQDKSGSVYGGNRPSRGAVYGAGASAGSGGGGGAVYGGDGGRSVAGGHGGDLPSAGRPPAGGHGGGRGRAGGGSYSAGPGPAGNRRANDGYADERGGRGPDGRGPAAGGGYRDNGYR